MRAFALILTLLSISSSGFSQVRVEQILERLNDANSFRDHVMIVAHRGLWSKNAQPVYAEGSITSIENAIALGIEVVELDIRKSRDDVFVILHDSTLDRTTSCSGKVSDYTIEEIKQCKLTIKTADGIVTTDESVPTLEEVYVAIKDRILINLDNKIGYGEFPAMFRLAEKLEVDHQILATISQNSSEQRSESAKIVEQFKDTNVNFLPNLYDSDVGMDTLEGTLLKIAPPAVQLRNYHAPDGQLTKDGGVFFSARSLKLARKHNAHYWINTLYAGRKRAGMRSGGRGDEMAIYANLPSEVYGFWVERGVTIFQTDEPEAALVWLENHGHRRPYN